MTTPSAAKIAISNRRILGIADAKVTFTYKDRRNNDRQKVLTLDTDEFVRRFLLHVLPARFHKIRHFGLLSVRNRKTKLPAAQLQLIPAPTDLCPDTGIVVIGLPTAKPRCPVCGANARVLLEIFPPKVFRPVISHPTARAPPPSFGTATSC